MSRQQLIAGIDVGSSNVTTLIVSVTPEDRRPKIIGVAVNPSRGIKKGSSGQHRGSDEFNCKIG